MVSQFKSPDQVQLLGSLDFPFPEGTHAIGRLDSHSEGLLILTTNKKVTKLLFESAVPHKRTYWVRVKGHPDEADLQLLRTGIAMPVKGNKNYVTAPCTVEIVEDTGILFPRPKTFKEWEQHAWLSMILTEGKFHQVRKMVRLCGHRCQRLIRMAIENLTLDGLPPGKVREIKEADFFEKLNIKNEQHV